MSLALKAEPFPMNIHHAIYQEEDSIDASSPEPASPAAQSDVDSTDQLAHDDVQEQQSAPNSKAVLLPNFESVSYDRVQDLYEQRKGTLYFIPEGFEPVLVPNDTKAQTVTNLLETAKQVSAPLNVPRMLPDTDVRLPTLALPCGVTGPQSKGNSPNGKSKVKKPPRPPNAFILYRRAKQPAIVAKNAGITNNEVSKEIGRMWHEEPLEVRVKFQKMAEDAKQEHMKKYPEYRYRPRRPQERKRRVPLREATTPPRRSSTPTLPSDKLEESAASSPSFQPRRASTTISNDGDSSDVYSQSPTQQLLSSRLIYHNPELLSSPQQPMVMDAQLPYHYYLSAANGFDQQMMNQVPQVEYGVFDPHNDGQFDVVDFEEFDVNMNFVSNEGEGIYMREPTPYVKFDTY
ncbi:865_t:CDS:1 [Paraglomus occultum]|uniref:865_t:CDS:1 n=1 Tax=Paraglomus occultum TaxID=144539 RepID=A0A9N9FXS6_9GLOM|nr:865_t:CDS:1 [Paraglomus occultum]